MAMGVEVAQGVMGEQLIDNLGFLQADNMWSGDGVELVEQGRAQAHGIDVPGGDSHGKTLSVLGRDD